MGIVSRPGDHNYADPNTARGAGETSLYSPNRSNLDYNAALGRVGDTAQQAGEGIRGAIDGALDGVVEFIKEVTGIDLSGEEALLEQLLDAPLAALEGTPLGQALTMLGQFMPFLSGGDAAGFNPLGAARDFVVNRLLPTGVLLGPDSPLSAKNLIGTIRSELLGVVPVGALTSQAPNRLRNGTFAGPDAIAPAGDWKVDLATSRTADGSGSGRVVADGRPHSLVTGEGPGDKIPVAAGQTVVAVGYLMHEGAVGGSGGPSVLLQVWPFTGEGGETALTPVAVDTYTPGVPDLAWPGRQITGKYVVPEGVTFVQGTVDLTVQALQGVYHVDDFDVAQVADMSAIPGLQDALQGLDNARRSLANAIASAARGFPVVGDEAADVVEALSNFNPANIGGLFGSPNLAGDLGGLMRQIVGGARGAPVDDDEDISLTDVYNAVNQAVGGTAGADEFHYAKATTAIPVDPTWVEWIDAVPLGEGQPGQNGVVGFFGQGGAAAVANPTTWHRGEHFDNTLTEVQVTIENGACTISIPGHSITSAKATGPQVLQLFGGWQGKAVAPLKYNGKDYLGGGAQNMPGAAAAGPGAGGAGGRGIVIPHGGSGGPAMGSVRFRKDDVANPSTGADTTPPGAPTVVDVVQATNDSLTFRVAGSVDA